MVSSVDPKILRKEAITSALIADVWTVWTTNEGITSFLAPKANIKLEDQGPYEIFFDPEAPLGFRGTEGCKILGLESMKTLSVEWDEAYEFFDRAWDLDLARMQQRFSSGPIDWTKPYVPAWLGAREQRIRDHVLVETR